MKSHLPSESGIFNPRVLLVPLRGALRSAGVLPGMLSLAAKLPVVLIRPRLTRCEPSRRTVASAVAITLLIAARAVAQTTSEPLASPTPAAPISETERVMVTGSNIPTAEEAGPEPVDTYRPEDIEQIGARTATDFTQRLPAVTGAAVNQNNLDSGDARTEVNLRGLFPKETLVLVDGRRVAPVGFALGSSVDLNLIPFPLLDRIDILKDGASAIYGSDAVAGVFNASLKHKFREVEVGASYGNTNLGASNDSAEREAYLLAGVGDDKTDIVVFVENYDRDAIYLRDRGITSTGNYIRFGGIDMRTQYVAGRLGPPGFVLRPDLKTPTPHSAPNPASSSEYIPTASAPKKDQVFDFAPFARSLPASDRQYVYGSILRDLYDKYLTVFADFKYARSFVEGMFSPVLFAPDPFKRADGTTPVGRTGISIPLSNPFNPFTVANEHLPDGTPVFTGVRYRETRAGPRDDKVLTNDYLSDAGLRGNLGEFGEYFKTWNFELGFRYNLNDHTETFDRVVSAPALRAALLDTNPATAFNAFGRNVNPKSVIDKILISTEHSGDATLTDEVGLLNGDIVTLPAGPLFFALGSEHRRETVNDVPDSLSTSFQLVGAQNLQATSADRDVWSYFGQLRIPITSPRWNFPGAYSLEFQAAERIEQFSDFGTTERPKFSVRYQPLDSSLTFRASYAEAFHAPELSDLSASQFETFGSVVDPAHQHKSNFTRLLFGGQPNLRPEIAYGFTYGAVWSPRFVKGLTLSADFYHLDLRDRTSFINPSFVVNGNFVSHGEAFRGDVLRDATGTIITVIDLTQNIHRTITEGIDYEAIYRLDTAIFGAGGFGTFTFTLNGNYLSRYVATIDLGLREREYAGQESFAGYLPHNRFYGSIFYDLGGLDTGVIVHFISQGSDFPFGPRNGIPRKIREWTTLDAIISYTFKLARTVPESQMVPGYAKDGGKTTDAKDKDVLPVSTAQYSAGRWRAWLNGTKITLGVDNIFDLDPPFVAGSLIGYDESTFNIQGRFYYASIKKRF